MINHAIISGTTDKYATAQTTRSMNKHPKRTFEGIRNVPLFIHARKDLEPMEVEVSVLQMFGITREQLRSKARFKNLVFARQTFFYVLKKGSQMNLREVGVWLGGFDHATVLHSIKQIQNYIDIGDEIGLNAKLLLAELKR